MRIGLASLAYLDGNAQRSRRQRLIHRFSRVVVRHAQVSDLKVDHRGDRLRKRQVRGSRGLKGDCAIGLDQGAERRIADAHLEGSRGQTSLRARNHDAEVVPTLLEPEVARQLD